MTVATISSRQAEELFPSIGSVKVRVLVQRQLRDGRMVVRVVGSTENGYPQVLRIRPEALMTDQTGTQVCGELEQLDSRPARYLHRHFYGWVRVVGHRGLVQVPHGSLLAPN